MFAVLMVILSICLAIVLAGIAAFVYLPVKAGIAIAVIALIAAVALFTWFAGSIDLSH